LGGRVGAKRYAEGSEDRRVSKRIVRRERATECDRVEHRMSALGSLEDCTRDVTNQPWATAANLKFGL